ncbi:hypothetical protein EVAR_95583_1 [Eumeta japonica]|uniref:Uncharacterized protein n=1 Tax=Eumeta variegata TaxID=151549 RepID=A0A4C1VM59_EUMVA|nr:hypothetical protein EVAR_95583_1 [Eumeta japonica]
MQLPENVGRGRHRRSRDRSDASVKRYDNNISANAAAEKRRHCSDFTATDCQAYIWDQNYDWDMITEKQLVHLYMPGQDGTAQLDYNKSASRNEMPAGKTAQSCIQIREPTHRSRECTECGNSEEEVISITLQALNLFLSFRL